MKAIILAAVLLSFAAVSTAPTAQAEPACLGLGDSKICDGVYFEGKTIHCIGIKSDYCHGVRP